MSGTPPAPGELGLRDRLLYESSAASDLVLRPTVASLLAGASAPSALRDGRAER